MRSPGTRSVQQAEADMRRQVLRYPNTEVALLAALHGSGLPPSPPSLSSTTLALSALTGSVRGSAPGRRVRCLRPAPPPSLSLHWRSDLGGVS
eukprot:2973226-Rhodomonas_salina.1